MWVEQINNKKVVTFQYINGDKKSFPIDERELYIDHQYMVKIRFNNIAETTLSRTTDGETFSLCNEIFFLTEEEKQKAALLLCQASYEKAEHEWQWRKRWESKHQERVKV